VPFAFLSPPRRVPQSLFQRADFAQQRAFFAARPDLSPTPLRALPGLAHHLGVGALEIKDETARFGLNAFKAVGATFAVETLRERGKIREGDTLVCASEGNHGRAVARAARDADCFARVYMAETVAPARVAAVQAEGAVVVPVRGTYDDAVRVMAAEALANGWAVISDTSWPGYDEIPRLIMLGYTRLLDEADAASPAAHTPDAIFVQGGVGGLLGAVASWVHWRYDSARPRIVCVEPAAAACLQRSAQHGAPTTLAGPFDTIMGGLRCGEVSPAAFDAVLSLVDAYVAIEDDWALDAIRLLAEPAPGDPPIRAGASGAAALGGLLATLRDPTLDDLRDRLSLGPTSRVLMFVTEGVTDPDVFQRALADRHGRA
jgi:diaminopropionate ammonia-lyase